jgi:predicted  nucleic acid-binding Zn-ribbon protein
VGDETKSSSRPGSDGSDEAPPTPDRHLTPAGGLEAPPSEPPRVDPPPVPSRNTKVGISAPPANLALTPAYGVNAITAAAAARRVHDLADEKPTELLKEVARLRRDLAKAHAELAELTADRAKDEDRYDQTYKRAEEADGILASLEKTEKERDELAKQLAQWQQQLTKVERDFVAVKADLELARAEVEGARKELEAARKDAQEKRAVLDTKRELEGENEALSSRIWDLEGENGSMRVKIQEINANNEELRTKLRDLEAKLGDAEERAKKGPPELRTQLGKSAEALAKIIELAREATPPPPPVAPRASVLPVPTPPPRPASMPPRDRASVVPASSAAVSVAPPRTGGEIEADPFPSTKTPAVAPKDEEENGATRSDEGR